MGDYKVTDDKGANWALRKLKELKAKREEKEEQAKEYIRDIEVWLEEECNSIDSDINYFEGLLTEYATEIKEQDPKLKTHKLPFGKLQFRKQRPKWVYDDYLLVKSVEGVGLDDLIKVTKSVSKSNLKKMVEVVGNRVVNKETGEIIEGVIIEERGEKFTIDY